MTKKIRINDLLDPKKLDKHKDELINYFGKGGTWQELLKYDESAMNAQYASAYELFVRGKFDEAATSFTYLTLLNPYEYNYWMGVGVSKQSAEKYDEALVSFTVAESIDPNNPVVHLNLAQCFWALKLEKEAREELRKVIAKSGKEPHFREIKEKAKTILSHLPKKGGK